MWRFLSLWTAAALIGAAAPGAPSELEEHQAKAVFLYKFASFVEWPAEAFAAGTSPFSICVLGQSPVQEILTVTVRDKNAAGRAFQIRAVESARDASACQILFVSAKGVRKFRALRPELSSASLLTVGESDDFASHGGGIVNLKLQDGRILLEINAASARQARLKINSRLLGMASLVAK